MQKLLPVRLNKCPIINCVCELRYTNEQPVEQLLPGILHSNLAGEKVSQPVPLIPPEIIKQDPNLHNTPSFSLQWDNFVISGNFSYVSVSFIPPYKRWIDFKNGIFDVFRILLESNIFSSVTR